MGQRFWGDLGSSNTENFEWTAPWLRGESSAYGLNISGKSYLSGAIESDLDGSLQSIEPWSSDDIANQLGHSITGSPNELAGDYGSFASKLGGGENTLSTTLRVEDKHLLGAVSGVNQDLDLWDSVGRLDSLAAQGFSDVSASPLGDWSRQQYDVDYQRATQLAFENGFERGFEKGFERGLVQQPKSIVFSNVQFAGGFAENVAGNVIGGSINNLSPVFSMQWEMIEKSLIKILDTLSFSPGFSGPEANIHKAYKVFKEIEKDSNLNQEIVDFKGALRANGLIHQSTNPVINIVLASF